MTPTEPSNLPLYIILNAGSGHAETDLQRQTIEEELARAGRRFELTVVEDPGELAQVAEQAVAKARQAGGIVVAAGGDGTINTVARATLSSGCPFGVLPQGTFNYFGRTHGIPQDLAGAVRALLTAHVQPVQVGRLNDRIFLVNASVGLYPTLLEQRERDKRQYGRSRVIAFLSAIKTILGFRKQLTIRFDLGGAPETIRTTTLFVGNNALQMEQVGIETMKLALEEGRLAAVAPRSIGKLATLGLLVRGAFGQLGGSGDLIAFGFRRMTVWQRGWYGRRRVKVAIDGEVTHLAPPLEFEVIEDQLLLLVPENPVRE
ncbi:diacylglycerol/lipid kinase family protein [Pseudoduganella sp. GCM10020061]|uniref:diacylglycerol/lipid kinase family protein n=1 Tax=Pseudoduganella sp. GCM10020061 TaxID=3317345 RepID=UPI00362C01B4